MTTVIMPYDYFTRYLLNTHLLLPGLQDSTIARLSEISQSPYR